MKLRGLVIFAAAVLVGAGAVWLVLRNKAGQPEGAGNGVVQKQAAERPTPAVQTPPPATSSPASGATPQTGVSAPSVPGVAGSGGTARDGGIPSPMTPPTAPAGSGITPLTAVPPRGPTPQAPSTPPAPVDDITAASIQLDQVGLMLRDFRTIAGGNPVGTNADIMKAVMGDNPRKARLGPPEGQSLNPQGELIDRWGTPYFFHQLSKNDMEIRSAGPDRLMWTPDDIVHH